MMNYSKSQEKHSHFNDAEINREEDDFIRTYTERKGGAFKILALLYKTHIWRLLLSAVFYAIKVSPTWIIPIITANLINLAVTKPEDLYTQITYNIIAAVVVLALNIPFHMLHVKYFSIARRNVEAGLRGAMIRKLQQLSISFHKEMQSGRIQSKVMRDVEAVEALSSQIFNTALDVLLSMSVTIAVVISKNFIVFLIFLVTIPIAVLTMLPFKKSMRKENHLFRKEMESTSSKVMDMVELVPITRAHALENDEITKLTGQVTEVAKRGYKLDLIQSLFGSVNWVIFSLFQIVCLVCSVILALNGEIGVGDISLYQTYFTSLVAKISGIVALLPIITKGTESVHSIGEILSSYDVEDYKGKEKLKVLKGEYEFKDIKFHYADDNRLVLKGLNLKINAGETIAFVGESGSGKTTIINMAIGFYKPTEGEMYIDGKPASVLDLHSYRQHLAVVPQNTILFSGTIRDNITYGKTDVSEEEILAAVEAANLKNVIAKLPDGLDTNIGEHGDKLSGGQRQRISIARAIIRKPDVIIFDEATSALDTVSEAEIQHAINNLTKDKTTFIVAHRLSTIRNADKIAVMRDGVCVEFGTYKELMKKKGEFYTYKTMQS
ncbi:MAG: ABC transporter ATP-binding protein [Acutalibacteraceae bacterium]|nr:ABC transporter ATP-binding protein [Acutalibacteraceae bacterium]